MQAANITDALVRLQEGPQTSAGDAQAGSTDAEAAAAVAWRVTLPGPPVDAAQVRRWQVEAAMMRPAVLLTVAHALSKPLLPACRRSSAST